MSLLSDMGIPPSDPLLLELQEEDDKVREAMEFTVEWHSPQERGLCLKCLCCLCLGDGSVWSFMLPLTECWKCGGSGLRIKSDCPTCEGTGSQREGGGVC